MTASHQPAPPGASAPTLHPAGFFCMRTPLLPFAELTAWSAGIDPASDVATLRARLAAVIERPEIREAIFIASPGLAGEIDVWRREPTTERGAKIERGLVRYFSRMCGRATPFGLFAGITVGTVGAAGDSTRLALAGAAAYRSHTRLDMAYVCALADDLLRRPEVAAQVSYRVNSSLYRLGDQLRYMEHRDARGQRAYGLVAVPATDYLCLVLARCASGARTAELIELLAGHDPSLGHAEITAYLAELVASQILIADFPPRVTGPEPLGELIARTEQAAGHAPGLAPIADALRDTQHALAAIDAGALGSRSDDHRRITARLQALDIPYDAARLFQVDLVKPAAEARLAAGVVAEIARAVELLRRLGPAEGDGPLRELAGKFARRFEGREVRLVEALDEEWGIAPPSADPSPLLAGLPFTAPGGPGATGGTAGEPVTPLHALLLREIQAAVQRGDREIILDEARLRPAFTAHPAPLAPALSAMVTIAAASAAAVDRGDYRLVIEGAKGPSGASLLGRFCHADPALHGHVAALSRAERAAHPDAIYAELVHLPQHRVGNIIARPVLTEYEIVYLGQSGAPADRQLPVTDLLVSVVGGKFVLRSERLGRQVIPRMTTAHALFGGLATYRFLGHLASEPALALRLGALEALPFIPRIVVGRAVLHLATWRLFGDELAALDRATSATPATPATRYAAVQALRQARGLPRLVAVKDLDNELPIDLDNALSVESFVHLVKARPSAQLVEIYPGADALCAEGPEGAFIHELVVPLLSTPAAATAEASARPAARTRRGPTLPACRQFPPGSEWLYVKLYTGTTAGDTLLRDVVDPLVAHATASRAASRWFFLRYADPEFHVRVRFHGKPRALRELIGEIYERCAPLVASGLIHRLQLDTYDREIERYGGDDGIALAEKLFHADSEAALAMVNVLDRPSGLDDRWRYALLGIDALLGDLRLDVAQRRAVIAAQRQVFGTEHAVGTAFERALGHKFRAERTRLEAMLHGGATDGDADLEVVRAALRRRTQRSRPVVDKLHQLERQGRLSVPVVELAKSFVHMHANRVLRSAPRAQELVLYDFLERCYTSQLARAKSARPAPALARGQA